MSRPAVESTLFRARRRLTEEYDELVSGQRCLRVQGIIATAAAEGTRLGTRDSRRLARHVAHCQPCRREALAAGLDAAALAKPLRTRVAAKVAGLLPFPAFLRRFHGSGRHGDAATGAVPNGGGWLSQLPAVSDQLGAGWGKAIAAAAVLLAGVGAGVGTNSAMGGSDRGAHPTRHAAHRAAPAVRASASAPAAARRGASASRRHASSGSRNRPHSSARRASSRPAVTTAPSTGATSSKPVAGSSTPAPTASVPRTVSSGATTPSAPSTPSVEKPRLSDVVQPPADSNPVQAVVTPVAQATAPVTETVQDTVQNTVDNTVTPVVNTVKQAVGTLAPAGTG